MNQWPCWKNLDLLPQTRAFHRYRPVSWHSYGKIHIYRWLTCFKKRWCSMAPSVIWKMTRITRGYSSTNCCWKVIGPATADPHDPCHCGQRSICVMPDFDRQSAADSDQALISRKLGCCDTQKVKQSYRGLRWGQATQEDVVESDVPRYP